MSKRLLGAAMWKLRDQYPTLMREDEEAWDARIGAYWLKLKRFDGSVIEMACDMAPEVYPARFPSVGQLMHLAIKIEHERKAEANKRDDEERAESEDKATRERVAKLRSEIIPDTIEGQERWVAEAPSRFEALARWWECQSKQLRLDPTKPSPPDVAKGRMAELNKLLAEEPIGGEHTSQTRQQPHQQSRDDAA